VSTDIASASRAFGAGSDSDQARAAFFRAHWRSIVTTRTPAIAAHLAAESAFVDGLLGQTGYRTVIEGGCGDGSLLLETVVARGLGYLGIDLAPSAASRARRRLTTARPAGGPILRTAVRGDLRDIGTIAGRFAVDLPETLVALPFNVLGNVSSPDRVLTTIAACQADVLVLTYAATHRSDDIRDEYYRRCGFPGHLYRDAVGAHFVSPLFTSSVYARQFVEAWLGNAGYLTTVTAYGEVGLAFHGRRATASR
jgi:hypothetical protein